jgi:hypothetical protein
MTTDPWAQVTTTAESTSTDTDTSGGGQQGQPQSGLDVDASLAGANPVEAWLAGSTWTREDLRLVLELVQVALLLYAIYASMEGS